MYPRIRTHIEYDIVSLSDPTFNLAKKGIPVIKKLGPSCEGLILDVYSFKVQDLRV